MATVVRVRAGASDAWAPLGGAAGLPTFASIREKRFIPPGGPLRVRVVFVGLERRPWREAALALATFGVRRRLWLYRVNREVDGHEALALRHGVTAALLASPIVGIVAALVLAGLRVPFLPIGATVLVASFLPSAYVTLKTLLRADAMMAATLGPTRPVLTWFGSLVPVLGTLVLVPSLQTRLNAFWAKERSNRKGGVEVDVDLSNDPAFLVELDEALKESYRAGSRFEAKRRARRQAWNERAAQWVRLRAERKAVRAAGGSVPLLPWRRPRRPRIRILHVTCGTCQTRFEARRDPAADSPIVCPNCGVSEVLPSLHSDPLRPAQKAAVPRLKVACPRCNKEFHAVHNLHGPTRLECPHCGRKETLVQVPKAARPETTKA
jgi:DNA-directed RNA polymerase subunit RPC12/RpoP